MSWHAKRCEGHCPNCGESRIDYGAIEIRGDAPARPCVCSACGQEFWEFLTYENTGWFDGKEPE